VNTFGHTSLSRLNTCHDQLQILFKAVLLDDDCTIICGHRTEAEQDKAYPKFSKVQWPNSKHNKYPSEAVDAGPYHPQEKLNWEDLPAFYLFAGKVIAKHRELVKAGIIDFDLKVGADWDGDGSTEDQRFHDLPHFEGSSFRPTGVIHDMWSY
jgi:peptidoglycan L-alanyl-D-glutamate endopeptidase CwlK